MPAIDVVRIDEPGGDRSQARSGSIPVIGLISYRSRFTSSTGIGVMPNPAAEKKAIEIVDALMDQEFDEEADAAAWLVNRIAVVG